MTDHTCRLNDVWPTGHPLPAEDPARLQGPEVGDAVTYLRTRRWATFDGENGARVDHEQTAYLPAVVLERSYVWSPGECRHNGGYRQYGSKVIRVTDILDGGRQYTVVVQDADLTPA